jgi:hypothetical protein
MAKSLPRARRSFWDRAIACQARSGLTQSEYCARHSLSLHVFRSRKYKGDRAHQRPFPFPPAPTSTPPFLPVRLVAPAPAIVRARDLVSAPLRPPSLELVLGRGCVLRIPPDFEARSLERVIALLEGGAC